MADVTIAQYMTLLPASPQPDYMAELFYGQNGDLYGPNELLAGTVSNLQGTHLTWDENPDDGLDSGWCNVIMVFEQGANGLQLQVGDSDVLGSSVDASAGISHVDILTTVQTQAAMLWSHMVVMFYKDGSLVDQVEPADFGVDETDNPSTGAQAVMQITPTVASCDEVIITGSVKLLAPEGVYPAEDAIFSQIMIYTA